MSSARFVRWLAPCFAFAALCCASQDVVLLHVENGGAAGASQGGTAQGGVSQGGVAQGGAAQGGAGQGGAGQGGSQGGAAQGGTAQGGAGQGGSSRGGAPSRGGSSSSSGGAPPPLPCLDDFNCPSGLFCEHPSCDVPDGICRRRPMVCDARLDPVCGCDGISYWNDCLRRQNGVSALSGGECTLPHACRYPGDCGVPRAECARLAVSGVPCGPNAPPLEGACWILPETCDPSVPTDYWTDCAAQSPAQCVDTCTAIRAGRPHVQADACQ